MYSQKTVFFIENKQLLDFISSLQGDTTTAFYVHSGPVRGRVSEKCSR